MKRSLGCILMVAFILSLFSIPACAKKAGKIEDDIFTDSQHGISFKVPSGWSTKIGNAKRPLRLALEQKSPVEPQQFQGELRDYMQVPNVNVLIDTCSIPSDSFFARLQDSDFESKQKEYFLKYMRSLRGNYDVMKSKDLTIEGGKATIIEIRQPYALEVPKATRGTIDRGRDVLPKADVINDNKTGMIFMSCRGGRVYVIHMICEFKTSGPLLDIFYAMTNTVKFE